MEEGFALRVWFFPTDNFFDRKIVRHSLYKGDHLNPFFCIKLKKSDLGMQFARQV